MMARLCELSFLNLPSLFLALSLDSFSQTSTYSIPVGRTSVGLTFKGGTLQTHLYTYSPSTLLLGLLSAFLPG